MPNPHRRDIGDRIQWPCRQRADDDAGFARARTFQNVLTVHGQDNGERHDENGEAQELGIESCRHSGLFSTPRVSVAPDKFCVRRIHR